MMACVEFVADQETKRQFPDELGIGKLVSNEADKLGLIVRPIENLNVMSPPLIITKSEIDFIVGALRQAIINTQANLGPEFEG